MGLIIWQIISFSQSSKGRKGKKSVSRLMVFLIALLVVATIPVVLRFSGWFSKENETKIKIDSHYLMGIDISHYTGRINWNSLKKSHHPIRFVFIRATMGSSGSDRHFYENWRQAGVKGYIRGAYHYYRPGEDPALQFRNFKKKVKLASGDFRPILDVEQIGRLSREKLRYGVKEWLRLAEAEYGVKPLVYSGLTFYKQNLLGHLNDYPLWIAAYDGEHRLKGLPWKFHQFTDKLAVIGANEFVDGNTFRGNLGELRNLCMP